MLCKYKDIADKPREGIHAIRVFDVAIIDVVFTVVGATILAHVLKWDVLLTNIAAFLIGIIVHRLFCVNTRINTFIFGEVSTS